MGIVMSDNLALRRRRTYTLVLLLLLLGLATLATHIYSAHRAPDTIWSILQLSRAVKIGEVSRLHLAANRAIVETNTGIRAQVVIPAGGTIIGALTALGVTEESMTTIEIVHQALPSNGPAGLLQQLFQWFWSVPIIILVGAGSLALRHLSKRCYTIRAISAD